VSQKNEFLAMVWTRHIFEYDTVENLVIMFREYLPPYVTVAIHCSLEDLSYSSIFKK